MLELLKIKRDINWLIDQIKCLIRKSDLDSPLSATEWSANHSTITGNPYIVDCFVWFEGKVYKSLINNNIYPPTNATYWANLGLGHLLLEEQTDWNATTGRALLKNKPNLSQYALDSNVVHKTGNETIAGRKTFTDNITLLGDSKIISVTSADNETGFANIGIDETGMPYFQLGTSANENTAVIRADNINTNSTYQLPNSNGTIALDENLVHKTGNETIDGVKSFNSTPKFNSGSINIFDDPASGYASINVADSSFLIKDSNNNSQFYIETGFGFIVYQTNTIAANFFLTTLTQSRVYTLPNANGTIALDGNLVHKTGNETIAGFKTFNETITVSSITSNSGQLVLASGGTNIIISDDSEQIIANREFIAPSLRIPEGTSTQFLKADGSVDNNVYAINSSVVHMTGNENIDGIKSFIRDLVVNGISIGRGGSITSVLMGNGALQNNTNGNSNVAIGSQALFTTTNASSLVAIGQEALFANTSGSAGVAVGAQSLNSNTTGNNNTAVGRESLKANTIGFNNTAVGRSALLLNVSGNNNTVFGTLALQDNISGNGNVAIGSNALSTTTGNNNIGIGLNALQNNTSGGGNIGIGQGTSTPGTTNTNSIVIGNAAVGLGSNTTVIGTPTTTITGLYGNIRLVSGMAVAPASATAPGTLGDIRVTAGFIYVCIATNTWVRTALTSW